MSLLRIQDRFAQAAIRDIQQLLDGRVNSRNLNLSELCEAIGMAMLDGQLGVLSRALNGSTQHTAVALQPLAAAPSNPQQGWLVLADRATWDPLAKGS